jgi:methyl coenzyme M reductase subunit C-like uncharacterized protein (methanogenesis marker protein 7)
MHEFSKLKTRLKNMGKNASEYRMTVAEARALVIEIEKELSKTPVAVPAAVVEDEVQTTIIRILDGGTF